MTTLAENIKYYRKLNKLTQKLLAEKLNIAPTVVSAWELGRNKPLMDNVEHMSKLFNIPKSKLLGDDFLELTRNNGDKTSASTEAPKTVSDEVLRLDRDLHKDNHKSWINYGNKLLDKQNTVTYSKNTVNEPQTIYHTYNYYDQPASAGTGQYLNDVQVEQIELPIDVDADFVVPIYGDSMEPEYHSGDYVFVKLSVELSDGDIGVFDYYGDAYIKELVINDSGAYLHSLNPKYDDILIDADSDFRIIGEVVGRYSEK